MTTPNETELVASALRRLKDKPCALLRLDYDGTPAWDAPSICDLPVFHANELAARVPDENQCPWVALYPSDKQNDGWRFSRLYTEAKE